MAQFVKKPIVVEAEQFLLGHTVPFAGTVCKYDEATCAWFVTTAHNQDAYLDIGDWVILEKNMPGRAYPCKPDIFAATYDKVGT